MKKLLFTFTAFFIFDLSPSFATPYYEGTTPGWVLNCRQIEKNRLEHTLVEYNKCNSAKFGGYMDNLSGYMGYFPGESYFQGQYSVDPFIQSVHVLVTDTKIDRDPNLPYTGICDDTMCYRAFVFINGDSSTGTHVATWATSPGKKWTDGSGGNYTPDTLNTFNSGRHPNQNSKGYFMLQQDHEMGLKGVVTGKYPGFYVMNHYVNSDDEDMPWATCYHFGTCFHVSGQVNGKTESHGCTRLKYIEAKKINFLARHVGRNFTVETRFTERETLTDEERRAITLREVAVKILEENIELRERAQQGDADAQGELFEQGVRSGGIVY